MDYDIDSWIIRQQPSPVPSSSPPPPINKANLFDVDLGPEQYNGTNKLNKSIDIYDQNYEDVDALLTRELQDLDIPIIPETPVVGPTTTTTTLGQQAITNKGEEDMKWAEDMLNFNIGNPIGEDNTITNSIDQFNGSATKHKRGPSGTAIFGFLNHNKTLSISSVQRQMLELSRDNELMASLNTSTNGTDGLQPGFMLGPSGSNNSRTTLSSSPVGFGFGFGSGEEVGKNQLSNAIMKQQEELREALDRQREVNKKLQEQLRENQIQQKKLQEALREQQNRLSAAVNEGGRDSQKRGLNNPDGKHTHQQRKSPETGTITNGSSNNSSKNGANDDGIIVTSNSADGKYRFPPPSMLVKTDTAAKGETSNGDGNSLPSGFTRGVPPTTQSRYLFDIDSEPSPADCVYQSGIEGESVNLLFEKYNESRKNKNYLEGLNSPPRKTSQTKAEGETVSTESKPIFDGPSTNPTGDGSQGVRTVSTTSSVLTIPQSDPGNQNNQPLGLGLSKVPPLTVMPTILGSKANTPIKGNLGSASETATAIGPSDNLPKKYTFQHTPIKVGPQQLVPQTQPQPTLLPHTPDLKEMVLEQQILHSLSKHTPPPPPPTEITSSPLKITRKATTLPRGLIDM